jgi:N-acetyl-anhydromuramyl-L-alanine amidase AmpD
MTTPSSGWMPGATIKKSPNFAAGRNGLRVKGVVLHVTGGAAGKEYPNAVSWLSSPQSGVSAHFVLSQTGDITQLVSINDSAFANGLSWSPARGSWIDPEGFAVHPAWMGLVIPTNPNWYTISLEHAGQSHDVWSPAMFDANTRVLQWIRQQLGIVYRPRDSLIGHNEISPVNRPYCPGPNVNYERIAAAANSIPVTPILLQKFVVVSRDDLNIREGHGINPATGALYPIALNGTAKLKPGTVVETDAAYADGWHHLVDNRGFVSGAYLKMVKE